MLPLASQSRTCLSVLLDDVAGIIELGKRAGQLIQKITQRVWCQIRNTPVDDFWKPENQLGKFPLLWIVQLYGSGVGR